MKTKEAILKRMSLFSVGGGGIGSWLTDKTPADIFVRLGNMDSDPLSAVQLNQLLVLAHEAPVSDGFFRYYWLEAPELHTYSVRELPGFQTAWLGRDAIQSLDHLAWGLYRLYVDALLYFGNVRTAFRTLRDQSSGDLRAFFSAKRFDTRAIKRRGEALPLRHIDREKRYLISEMACKSWGDTPETNSRLKTALLEAYADRVAASHDATTTLRALLSDHLPSEFGKHAGELLDVSVSSGADIESQCQRLQSALLKAYTNRVAARHDGTATVRALLRDHLSSDLGKHRSELLFAADEILDASVSSAADIESHCGAVAKKFSDARADALENTRYYLSMLTDLDVYVATSMRSRSDFMNMAEICDSVFLDERLKPLTLRYFDPTLSAAKGHEDKGLIECLMVKCAKALLYCAGDKESYGKDCEAAMALSLGRPVIFYCDHEQRSQFYRDIHPLSRLVEFRTGVAVGAMVTDSLEEVKELLARLFENRMVYRLQQPEPGFLRLKEDLTESVVRLQTNNELLTETFWNHYHRDQERRPTPLKAVVEELRPKSATVVDSPPAQGELLAPGPEGLTRLAARTGAKHREIRPHAVADAASRKEAFPLSLGEMFDGISRAKSGQTTGRKRLDVLAAWLKRENVESLDAIRLLRFIERTIEEHKLSGSFVYTSKELTRWFVEMGNGEVFGTK